MAILNQSLVTMKEKMRDEEFFEYKISVANVMGTISVDIISKIYKEFPDLEPKNSSEWQDAGGLGLSDWLE